MAGVVAVEPNALDVRRVTPDDVREFALWRYEEPYDAYDLTDPVEDLISYFTAPETRCHVVVHGETLVAFCTFGADGQVPGGDYSEDALDIGLGVNPGLTGQGLGVAIVATVVGHVRGLAEARLRVTIAAGNVRAQKVWQRNGFSKSASFEAPQKVLGSRTFVIMTDS